MSAKMPVFASPAQIPAPNPNVFFLWVKASKEFHVPKEKRVRTSKILKDEGKMKNVVCLRLLLSHQIREGRKGQNIYYFNTAFPLVNPWQCHLLHCDKTKGLGFGGMLHPALALRKAWSR